MPRRLEWLFVPFCEPGKDVFAVQISHGPAGRQFMAGPTTGIDHDIDQAAGSFLDRVERVIHSGKWIGLRY